MTTDRKLTPKEKAEIVALRASGMPTSHIACRFSVPGWRIRAILNSARGVEPREDLTQAQARAIGELIRIGRTDREIAKAHGLRPDTIARYRTNRAKLPFLLPKSTP